MNTDPDSVRQEVSSHFANRTNASRVAIPALERYTAETLSDLPEGAVACSDGCGNPLLYTDIRPGQTVLDLGSGAGLDLLLAARKVGAEGRVIGVDMTSNMLRLATENAKRAGLSQIELRKGLIEELPVESGSVDWVISNCVINLSPQKSRVFAEIARVLKPGGRMVLSDTVIGEVPSWMRALARSFSGVVDSLIDEEAYLAIVAGSGLRDVQVLDRTVFSGRRLRSMIVVEAGRYQTDGGTTAQRALASGERACLTPLAFVGERVLAGKVSSIKVTAYKPE